MKKMLTMLSAVLVMALLFSISAFAEQTDRTAPGNYDLNLETTIAGTETFTVSIPSGTATLSPNTDVQNLGSVTCTAFGINTGKKISVAYPSSVTLTRVSGSETASAAITPASPVQFTAVNTTGTAIKAQIGTLPSVAGKYTGTLTFAVSLIAS